MYSSFNVPNAARRFAQNLVLFGVLCAVSPAIAQQTLTVDQVIAMHKAGVPAAIIKQNIKGKYKLKMSDLRKLKAARVPSSIVELMKGKSVAAPKPKQDKLENMKATREFEKRRAEQEAKIQAAAEAARRSAEKEQEALEQQRIERALTDARKAKSEQNYGLAAKLFHTFIRQTDPNRPAVDEATVGLAESYAGLGLYANAVAEYFTLLEKGPQSRNFQKAFSGLRAVGQIVPIDSDRIYGLADYEPDVDAPKAFQNSYNYFVGRFLFTKGDFDRAERFLSLVEIIDESGTDKQGVDSREDYARAQYMLGLAKVELSQNSENQVSVLSSSTRGFVESVSTAEAVNSESMQRLAQLGYLALARVSFTIAGLFPEERDDLKRELYDVAIYYYRKVPFSSTNYVNAMFEAGWSYYFRGDYRRGLGFFHALDGPEWEDHFIPGVYLAEADVYVSKCHVESAQDALARFNESYLAMRPAVSKFLDVNADPMALYRAFVLGESESGHRLPDAARQVVYADPEFYEAFTEVDRMRSEAKIIDAEEGVLGADLSTELRQTIMGITEQRMTYLGVIIQNILQRKVVDEIEYFESKRQDLEDDIYQAKSVATEEAIQALAQGKDLAAEASEQQAASMFVGAQYIRWPFEGSFWSDEVKSYRSNLEDRCQ